MDQRPVSIYQLALRTFTPEGTLKAAARLLPHIAGCGFTHIQLTPVTEAEEIADRAHWSVRQAASGMNNPRNPYILKDYYRIDPEYGDEADLRSFIREAHALGLKVLLDLVYYHCGRHATLVTEHPDWMIRDENGEVKIGRWNTPSPDYTVPELREYMWENMEHFIREFDCDGYRCDVGDMVPYAFWEEGIRRCRALKPDIFMVNEGREAAWLKVFDCDYFYEGCFDLIKVPKAEMTAADWQALWQECRDRVGEGGRVLRFLDNHDVCSDSFEDRYEKVVGNEAMEALHVLNFTLDGVPFVFNGNELADELKHSMFSNRFCGRDDTLQWENALCPNGQRRMAVVRALNDLRARVPGMNGGELTWVGHDSPDAVLAFLRPGGDADILVAVNLRDEPVSVRLDLKADILRTELESGVRARRCGDGIALQMLGYGYLVAAVRR